MARKIFRSGNSTVVSIPPEILELLNLEPGCEVNVVADLGRRRIVITPIGQLQPGEPPAVRDRVGALLERYAPALERLAAMEERDRDAAERGIDATALDRARALREAFAAQHGVLNIDLVHAIRAQRGAESKRAFGLPEEDQNREPRR